MKKIISLAVLCAFSFANRAFAAGLAPEDFNKMYALAHNGEVYALRGSVQRGLNIDSLDKYGNTGLCVSIYRNDQRAYNTFRAAGANPRHPCTQNIPTARYESFMSSSRVVAVNETPRQAFNVIHTGFMYSTKFWTTALTGVAGIAAIAMAGGGGGGSSAVEETPLLAGDKSVAIISGTKKLEPLVDEETGETTEQNLIGKIYYNDVETLDELPEISSVTSAIDILERGYTITKMPLSLAQNFGVYFKVTNGASVNSYTVPEVSAGQIGMVVQGYKTEYRDETIIETDDDGNEVEKTIKVPYTKVSSLKNYGKIDVVARNGAIGMVAGNYAEATNLNEIELKLTEGGTFKNAAIVGMYGDTGSSIFNESNISGHMEPAAGSGSGSIIGMMLSFVSKITDKLPTYDDEGESSSNEVVMKATNSGTITLESNNANTIGLVGMGSYLASNISPASSIGSAILENTGTITITYKATDTSEDSQSNPISLVGGQGLVGGMGMRADAKTTAINSNRITIIGGQNSAAGMVAVNGGKIQNDKEIIIGDGKTITSAFGMAALNGTRRGYISEIINNGTINLKAGTSGSKAIYIEGQTKVTLGANSKIELNASGQSVIYNGNQDGTALGTDSAPITLNGTITLNGAANVTSYTPQYVLEGNFGKVENKGTITFNTYANGSLLYQNGKMGTFTNSGTIIWNSKLAEDYDLDYLLDANEFVNNGTFTVNRQLYAVDDNELNWLIKGSNVNKNYVSTGNITINNSDYTGGIAIINDSGLKDSSSLKYDGSINVPGNGIYTENVGNVSFTGTISGYGEKASQAVTDKTIINTDGMTRTPRAFGIFALRAEDFYFKGTIDLQTDAQYGIFNTGAISSYIEGNIKLTSSRTGTFDAVGIYVQGKQSNVAQNTATIGVKGNTLTINNQYSSTQADRWTYQNVGIEASYFGNITNNYNLNMTTSSGSWSTVGIGVSKGNKNFTGNGDVTVTTSGQSANGYEIGETDIVTIEGNTTVRNTNSNGTAGGIYSNGRSSSITNNGKITATTRGIYIEKSNTRTNLYSNGEIVVENPDAATANDSGIFARYMAQLINKGTISNSGGTLSYGIYGDDVTYFENIGSITIKAGGEADESSAIYIKTAAGTLKNSGAITNTSGILQYGIYGENVGTFDNSGVLNITGSNSSNSSAIYLTKVDSFTNSGTITGKSLENGIYAMGDMETSSFWNKSTGTIDGNAKVGIGADGFNSFENNAKIGGSAGEGIMNYGISVENINEFTNTGEIFMVNSSAKAGICGYDVIKKFLSSGEISVISSAAQYGIYLHTETPHASDIDITGDISLSSTGTSAGNTVTGIHISQDGEGPDKDSDAFLGKGIGSAELNTLKVYSSSNNAIGIYLRNIMTTINNYVITVTGIASSQNLTGIDIATTYEDEYAPSNAEFTNNGQITINSAQSNTGTIKGINAKEMKKLTNNGDITINATSNALITYGIYADGSVAEIINNGIIGASSGSSGTRIKYGIYVNTYNGTANITNTAEKIETSEVGIQVNNTNNASVTNEGSIIADGNAIIVVANKFVITNTASLEGHGTNNGTMGTALGVGIVATHCGSDSESTVTNSGNIINSNYGIIAKIYNNAQNSKISITNSGDIGKSSYDKNDIQLRVGINGYANQSNNTIKINTTADSNIYVNTPGGAYAPAVGILAGAELTTLDANNTDKIENYTNANYVNNAGNITATINSAGASAYGIYVYNGGAANDDYSHSVINSGNITINADTGNAYGIYINSGTVKNSGNIIINNTGNTSYGIYQENGSTVLNTGSISGAIYGIYSKVTSNSNTIKISNGDANATAKDNENATITGNYGMVVDLNKISVPKITMENYGTITASIIGMDIKNPNSAPANGSVIANRGTINLNSSSAIGMNFSNIIISAKSKFENSGTINVKYNSSIGVKIDCYFGSQCDSSFTNSGTINVSGSSGYGIKSSYNSGTITNAKNGTINVTGQNSTGIYLQYTDTKLDNSGTITTAANDAYGIYSETYTNQRSSAGTVNIVNGTGLYQTDNKGTVNITAGMTGLEDITNTTGAGSIGILNANNLSGGKLNISSNIDNSNNSILKEDVTASGYTFTGPIGMKQSGGHTESSGLMILYNRGRINVDGKGAIGTWAENMQDVYNESIINVSGDGSVGMVNDGRTTDGNHASVTSNNGSIYVTGDGAAGMFTFGGSGSIRNKFDGSDSAVGNIIVSGNGSYGMYATGAGSYAENNGKIWVTGENSYGMFADNGATATNNGTIYVTGAGSYGMRATNGGTVVNNGTISVYGNGAGGMWASGNSTADMGQKVTGVIYIEKTSGDEGQSVGIRLDGSKANFNNDLGIGGTILINDTRDDLNTIGILAEGKNNTIQASDTDGTISGYYHITVKGKNNIGLKTAGTTINGKNLWIRYANGNTVGGSSYVIKSSIDSSAAPEAPKENAPTVPVEWLRAALAAALNIPEEDLELVFEDEDSDESLSAAAEDLSEDSSSGGSSLEDSIIIDENSTFVNNGTLLTNEDINFDNLTKAKGSSFQVTSSSIIAGNSFSGNVVANSEIVMTDENLREYSTENSFLGEDNGLTVTSGSYMFDASTQDNEGSIGIVMSMRDFNDIMEDKNLGDYLSANYDNGNRIKMFNRMKAATHKAQYDKIVNDELGLDFVPSLAKQNMDFNRDFTAQLNDEIFENLKNSHKDFITGIQYYHHRNSSYEGLEGYKSNGSNLYSLYNEDISNTVNYGLGMSIGTNTSKFDDDSSTYQAMAQVYVPVALSSGDTTFVTMPQFGAGYGRYKRKVEGDKTHRANISSYTYGVSNQLRRGFEFEGLTIEPVAEINVLGLYSGKIKEKDNMFVKSQNAVSIEGGLGLYLGKSIEYANSSTLRLRFGGTYYREMNNPYQRISAGFADADGYYNMHGYNNSHNRGVISLKADYGWRQFNFYVKAAEYIEKNSNFSLQGGMNYKF